MQSESITARLKARLDSIDTESIDLRSALARLETERNELTITLRTLERMGVTAKEAMPTEPISAQPKMTVPEMIVDVMGRPELAYGVRPDAVLNAIRETYEPNIDPNNVRPTMWRMAKEGRLTKRDELYFLPHVADQIPEGATVTVTKDYVVINPNDAEQNKGVTHE
ncbi:MAG: hypothetical protein P4M15_07225 [Alphaproteobacteria bacterium]|nr:hypothetical protein [Alphaproteobacteria bacterium]